MVQRVLVLHGPNVAVREGFEVLEARLSARANALGLEVKSVASNGEAGLLDALHRERTWAQVAIVNPATLAPSAYALAEALELLRLPAVEVLLEVTLRSRSVLKDVVQKQIAGSGFDGYLKALEVLAPKAGRTAAAPEQGRKGQKSLGRSELPPAAITAPEPRKTIGRKAAPAPLPARPAGVKSIGRAPAPSRPVSGEHEEVLTRSAVRSQIAERLSGRLSPAELATWARGEWQRLQRGAPIEAGQRELLDDVLQQLLLTAALKANDHHLITLMTQLGD